MALSEVSKNDKIEVVCDQSGSWCSVQVRNATIIMKDDKELTRAYHRHVVMPDGDVSAEDADVQAICNAAFTDDCKAKYATFLASQSL